MTAARTRPRGLDMLRRPGPFEASLWRRLVFQDELHCREDLFNLHRDVARGIARKQFLRRPPYGLERPDFEQLAYEGLLQAIDQFDPVSGAPFEAYARFRILGNITDGLARSSETGAQYSYRRRVERERLRSLRRGPDEVQGKNLTELSDLVVDLAIGLVLEGTAIFADANTPDARPCGYQSLVWKELQIGVLTAVAKLPDPEHCVIEQHYIHGVAFRQIAGLMRLSAGRVSQLHKSGIERLRFNLRQYI